MSWISEVLGGVMMFGMVYVLGNYVDIVKKDLTMFYEIL